MRKKLSEWSASEKNNTCFVFNQFPETKSQSPEKIGMVGRWFSIPFWGFGLPFQGNKHLRFPGSGWPWERWISWIAGSMTWSWFPLTKKLGRCLKQRACLGGGNSNIFYFNPYLGKWSNLTNIFRMGWNHQLVVICCMFKKQSDKNMWVNNDFVSKSHSCKVQYLSCLWVCQFIPSRFISSQKCPGVFCVFFIEISFWVQKSCWQRGPTYQLWTGWHHTKTEDQWIIGFCFFWGFLIEITIFIDPRHLQS